MQLTIETISLIIISLAALAVVSVIFLQVLSANIQAFRPTVIARVHNTEYVNESTWFLISVTYGNEIKSVKVRSTSADCPVVYREAYTGRTWELYGYCKGDVRGSILLIEVRSSNNKSTTGVKI